MSTAAIQVEHRDDLSNYDYQGDLEYDSNSSLRLFDASPLRYYHSRITKRIRRKPETPQMRMGSAVHSATLEPELFEEIYAVIPREVLSASGSKAGKKFEAWEAEFAGKVHVKQDEMDAIRWSVESVWSNPWAKSLLERATTREHSLFWTNKYGHKLKCRMDAAAPMEGLLCDLKRTAHAEADFWRSVRDFGYDAQAALYSRGFYHAYGASPLYHLIIVESEAPYECYVRTMPIDYIEQGMARNRATLNHLYQCKAGALPWGREGTDAIRDLVLPTFFYGDKT